MGRRQRVVVNSKMSVWADILSGIPEICVLGPILFVIFINTLPDVVTSTVKLFADDTKLDQSMSDHVQLQRDLYTLEHWSHKWHLGFNESKCKGIHLGSSNIHHNYVMNDVPLALKSQEKYLGVIVDDDMNFHAHVIQAVKKASFTCLDETTVPKLLTTIIRPHLEYGNLIWYPRFRRDKLEIEKIQHKATRLIPSLKGLSYEERLRKLSLLSLER